MSGIHSATGELITIIDLLEKNMSALADENKDEPSQSFLELKGSFDYDPASDRFPDKAYSIRPASKMLMPGCTARDILEKGINSFKQKLIGQLGAEWIKKYDPLINASEYLPGKEANVNNLPLILSLNSLSLLTNGVLATESAALKQIAVKK
jgi:hypothetical protein